MWAVLIVCVQIRLHRDPERPRRLMRGGHLPRALVPPGLHARARWQGLRRHRMNAPYATFGAASLACARETERHAHRPCSMIHHYIPFRRSPVKLDRMPSDVDAVTLRSSPGLTDSIYSIAVGDPRVVEDPVVVVHCTRTLLLPFPSPTHSARVFSPVFLTVPA